MAKFRVDVDFNNIGKVDAINLINDCIDELYHIKEELLEEDEDDE